MSLLRELQRRNVFRMAGLYVVTSWLLLQVADVLFPNLGAPSWAFGLVLGLLVLGFPFVLIFAWLYALTPEGLRRESDIDRGLADAPEAGRRMNVLIVVMLALAIGVVVLDRLFPESAPEPDAAAIDAPPAAPGEGTADGAPAPDNSLAVMPFADMSPTQDQAYLSDGLAEELLNLLARVPELRVASRTSAFSFRDKGLKLTDVAAELGVAHVLEGSVRKSGDRVRITAQLIDAAQDESLWSDSWDRTLDDVFAIQDEIAAAVVAALRVTLLGETPSAQTTDAEAYTLFLRAQHLSAQGSYESMRKAVELYDRALEIDAEYVPAWLGLGVTYTNLAETRLMAFDEAYLEVVAAVRRALELDPGNAEAYAMLGWTAWSQDGDYAAALGHYRKALDLDPNSIRALSGSALLLRSFGRLDDALSLQGRLIERDPVSAPSYYNRGYTRTIADDLDGARADFDRALDISPDLVLARVWRALVDYLEGDWDACLERFQRLSSETGSEMFGLIGEAMVLPRLDQPAEGAAALARLEEGWGRPFAFVIATIHADQSRPDEAFAWLERAYEYHGPAELGLMRIDPFLRPLHDDPRWPVLLERSGLSDEQIAELPVDTIAPR